jgi:tRNA (guanine-N7-)-methyltransferase
MSEASERAGAFFGRRKGKKLRAGQDELVQNLLPAIRVIPGSAPSSQFPGSQERETWLEIGFGGGGPLAPHAPTPRALNKKWCET